VTNELPRPLLWSCSCGWIGYASAMAAGYTCPVCGAFDSVTIAAASVETTPWHRIAISTLEV